MGRHDIAAILPKTIKSLHQSINQSIYITWVPDRILKSGDIARLNLTQMSIAVIQTESKSLQKRSIFQLCTLIDYYTNRSCTDYNDYGCFCGYGQEGRKAVDKTDAYVLRYTVKIMSLY
jgi:hypothetical protein